MNREEKLEGSKVVDRPPVPVISNAYFTDDSEIDVDVLGDGDLLAYVNYPDIKDGDRIYLTWRGANKEGEPFDAISSVTVVFEPDPDLGMPVLILNSTVMSANGGHAFLSYVINDPDAQESYRQFCFVGLRPYRETLPVVQVIESHDRTIVLAHLSSEGARVVMPPYRAMQPGDVVTLVFKGFDDQNYPLPTKTYPQTLSDDHPGKPLQWKVPKSQFTLASDGRVEMHYQVRLKGHADDLLAPLQTFSVPTTAPSLPAPLPKVRIDGYTEGPLNPGLFPSGMTLRLDAPSSARSGDHVILHWLGQGIDNRHTQSLRLDASSVQGSELIFTLDAKAVVDSAGDDIEVFYQIAHRGWALSADALAFAVEMPRVLPLPSVLNATAEGTGKGKVEATLLTREGARVTVPPAADIRPGETLRVHWNGHANGGRFVAETPIAGETRTFLVPHNFVAANMEQVFTEDEKRFEVKYEVVTTQGGIFSAPFNLRILPIAVNDYQPPQCLEAISGSLSVGGLSGKDATVEVASWAFMAVGHLVTLYVSGVDTEGNSTTQPLLTAQPVTQAQLSAGKVVANIPNAFLKTLKVGTSMSMNNNLSFDGGETTFPRGSAIVGRLTIRA